MTDPEATIAQILSVDAIERLGGMLLLMTVDGRMLDATPTLLSSYGYTLDELRSLRVDDFRAARHAERIDPEYRGPDGLTRIFQTYHRRKDGSVIPVEVRAAEIARGDCTVVLCSIADIALRDDAEESLLRSHARFDNIAATIPGLLYEYEILDTGGGRYTYIGPGCQELLGISQLEMLDGVDPLYDLVHPDDIERVVAEDAAAEGPDATFTSDFRIVTPSGETRWLHLASRPLPPRRGEREVWCGFILDITARKRAEAELLRRDAELAALNAELARQASTDSLTGLATRRHFYDTLEKAIVQAAGTGASVSVVSFDLDGLKRVNDTHGHARGDHLLVSFGSILLEHVREGDIAARLGGDEFSLILLGRCEDEARALGKHVIDTVRANPLLARLKVTVSAGVATWRPGELPDDMLQRADRELYAAKRTGGDSVAPASPS